MNNYSIYIHTNLINKKTYVGKAINPKSRWGIDGKGYKSCPRFWSAIQHYGWNNFNHKILETNLSAKEAIEREKYYISLYDSTNPQKGYNMTEGGTGGNTHASWTEEQIRDYSKRCTKENERRMRETDWSEKLSQSQKERWKREKELGIIRNIPRGKTHPKAKRVKCLETGQIFDCCADAAEWLGYDRKKSWFISRVASGLRNTCKGYHWEFVNE